MYNSTAVKSALLLLLNVFAVQCAVLKDLKDQVNLHSAGKSYEATETCGGSPGSHVYEYNDTLWYVVLVLNSYPSDFGVKLTLRSAQQPFRSTELMAEQCLPLDASTASLGFEVNGNWAQGVWLHLDDGCDPEEAFSYIGRSPYDDCCVDITTEDFKRYGPARSLTYG